MAYDYIVIGAGPAGIQMAYFLHKASRSYLVLEATDSAASFFRRFPRSRRLISLNKRFNYYPEGEYNLRHDWNSLLSDDSSLSFTRYAEELYPLADDLCRYLEDYAYRFKLNIAFSTRVSHISRDKRRDLFILTDTAGKSYEARRLLLATGAVKSHVPAEIEGSELAEGYENYSNNPSKYQNKRVAIVGRGNSAFEVADFLAPHAAIVHVLVSVPVRLAWNTHFPGDLRIMNASMLEMFQLKTTHAVLGFRPVRLRRCPDGTIAMDIEEDLPDWDPPCTQYQTVYYDHVIRCTGWIFVDKSIFDDNCMPETSSPPPIHKSHRSHEAKYPKLSPCWETSIPNMFYIGTAMQARDRRSASAFIQGFRYNIRTLFHILEERCYGVPLPSKEFRLNDLASISDYIVRRLSVVSALYPMNSVLCDVVVVDREKGTLAIYFELPVEYAYEREDFRSSDGMFTITFEHTFHKYPAHTPAIDFIHPPDVFHRDRVRALHAAVRFYSNGELIDESHLNESLVLRFDGGDYREEHGEFNAHKNVIYNFFNKNIKVTDEIYPDTPYARAERNAVFKPWTAEQVWEYEEASKARIPPPFVPGFQEGTDPGATPLGPLPPGRENIG